MSIRGRNRECRTFIDINGQDVVSESLTKPLNRTVFNTCLILLRGFVELSDGSLLRTVNVDLHLKIKATLTINSKALVKMMYLESLTKMLKGLQCLQGFVELSDGSPLHTVNVDLHHKIKATLIITKLWSR